MINKEIFEKHTGKMVKLGLKPSNFVLTGWIDAVFEDSIQFTTKTKTSYIDFEAIISISEAE